MLHQLNTPCGSYLTIFSTSVTKPISWEAHASLMSLFLIRGDECGWKDKFHTSSLLMLFSRGYKHLNTYNHKE